MTPMRVIDKFREIFPEFKEQIKSYMEAGKDAVQIMMNDGSVLYFAWRPSRSKEGWILSTSKEGIR